MKRLLYRGLLALSLTFCGNVVAASAADLGGNCCADLEERVAELESTVARKGNRKVSLTVYGHVNEAVMFWNNPGGNVDIQSSRVIPNTASQSRFGFKGEARVNQDWSAGFLIEIGIGGFDNDGAVNRDLGVRHSAVFIRSKSVGTIWLGHTGMASDGAAEVDISRASVAALPLSFLPMDQAIVGVALLNFDGPRRNVLKYVSPAVAGFTVSAAWSDEDTYDIALRFGNEVGTFRVAGAVAWRRDRGPLGIDTETDTIVGSVSVMEIRSGLFVGGAFGEHDIDGFGKVRGWEGRAGIELQAGGGATVTPFARYMEIEIADTTVAELFGGGLVWSWGPVDVYASYSLIDIPFGDDVQVGLAGARLRF
jgi:predicted porin